MAIKKELRCPLCRSVIRFIEVCNHEKTAWVCDECDTLIYVICEALVKTISKKLAENKRSGRYAEEWVCTSEECIQLKGRTVVLWSYDDLATSGLPVCVNCGLDMEREK